MVYLLLSATLILALWSLCALWFAGAYRFRNAWPKAAAALALGVVVYLYGAWIYLSVYAKYAFGICLMMVFLAGAFRRKKTGSPPPRKTVLNLLAAFVLAMISVLYFTGTTGRPETVALSFPLKKGNYFVLQGGKGLPANFFHYSYRGAVYAMDIVRLDGQGRRAERIFSPRLEDYHIFNDTVYSPCSGIIKRAYDDNPDNIPPNRERGPHNTNQLLIEAEQYYVFLAHLKKNGLLVQEGDTVKQGDPVALVGNSGYTLEPHLHIQVHKRTGKGLPWYKEDPLYIEFDGRSYLLFETITPKRVEMQ